MDTRDYLRHLIDFEGQAKHSKTKSVMKWWSKSKCISMIIAKTAGRNVAFKSGKLAESVFTSQADIMYYNSSTRYGRLF